MCSATYLWQKPFGLGEFSMSLGVAITALSILTPLAVLGASIGLFRTRQRYVGHPIAYRLALSALVALLCPTLVFAGHGENRSQSVIFRASSGSDASAGGRRSPASDLAADLSAAALLSNFSFLTFHCISVSRDNFRHEKSQGGFSICFSHH